MIAPISSAKRDWTLRKEEKFPTNFLTLPLKLPTHVVKPREPLVVPLMVTMIQITRGDCKTFLDLVLIPKNFKTKKLNTTFFYGFIRGVS